VATDFCAPWRGIDSPLLQILLHPECRVVYLCALFLKLKLASDSVVVNRRFCKFPEISKCYSSQAKRFQERRRKLWVKMEEKLTLLM
jgi:hypothetical protein